MTFLLTTVYYKADVKKESLSSHQTTQQNFKKFKTSYTCSKYISTVGFA